MIKVFYTNFDKELSTEMLGDYLMDLPNVLAKKINRYRKWEDRQSVLFGKLLLLKGLAEYGFPANCLKKLEYNKMGKPFLPSAPAFNISHSDNYVVCAFNPNGRIGIDIEKIKSVELNDYQFLFDKESFRAIRQAADPAGAFFENWTIREAVLKADGHGLTEDVKNIILSDHVAEYKETRWYIKPLVLQIGYLTHLATEHPTEEIEVRKIVF